MTLFSFFRIEFSILGIVAVTYVFPVIAALATRNTTFFLLFWFRWRPRFFSRLFFLSLEEKRK